MSDDVLRCILIQVFVLIFWAGLTALELYGFHLGDKMIALNIVGCLYNTVTVWTSLIKN